VGEVGVVIFSFVMVQIRGWRWRQPSRRISILEKHHVNYGHDVTDQRRVVTWAVTRGEFTPYRNLNYKGGCPMTEEERIDNWATHMTRRDQR
jgi:hypothetical protein